MLSTFLFLQLKESSRQQEETVTAEAMTHRNTVNIASPERGSESLYEKNMCTKIGVIFCGADVTPLSHFLFQGFT